MSNPLEGMGPDEAIEWFRSPPSRREFYTLISKMVRADVLVTSALSQVMSEDIDDAIPNLKEALQVLSRITAGLPTMDEAALKALDEHAGGNE